MRITQRSPVYSEAMSDDRARIGDQLDWRSRLVLGTAQLGQAYGIANRSGQVSRAEANRIVTAARRGGIDTLDTAASYSESEAWLGEIGVDGWNVISKLPPLPADCTDVCGWLRTSLANSLMRLRVKRLWGLLLHRPSDLLGHSGSALFKSLLLVKDEGLVSRLGVSVYDPIEATQYTRRFRLDIVQAPFNIFDRRMATSGVLEELREQRVEFHSRSIFLQGVLLMDADKRPAFFKRWDALFKRWDDWCASMKISRTTACLQAVFAFPEIARVLVGVDSESQLKAILSEYLGYTSLPSDMLSSEDSELLNPSRWHRT